MDSQNDTAMGEDSDDIHQPFTVEENIERLNAIDKSIVELMDHTATALGALTAPSSSQGDAATAQSLDPQAQQAAFRSSTDAFLTTLHSVDVQMKRHILALEEAGIVNLSAAPGAEGAAAAGPAPKTASLRPNGTGAVGNLDVGWLNSRGTKVERDMEVELWGQAKEFLERNGENMKL